MSSCLAHSQHFHQRIHHIVLKERKGITGLNPRGAILFLEYPAELFSLALFINELLHLRALQVFTIEAQIVVEHLCEDTQHCCLVLIDGSLNIDIEKDRVSLSTDRACDRHESRLIVKLLPEVILDFPAVHFLILQ